MSESESALVGQAVQQLTPEEKEVARSVLEGLVLKHIARKWSSAPTTVAKVPPAPPPAPAKRSAAKRLAASHR